MLLLLLLLLLLLCLADHGSTWKAITLLMGLILGMTMSAFQAGSHVTDMDPSFAAKQMPQKLLGFGRPPRWGAKMQVASGFS